MAFYGENASDNENIVAGKRFCGTYHGYTILLSGSDMDVYTDVEIGGFRFVWPNALRLCAYKDGAEYGVRGLYEAGTLTRADMEQIHAIYLLYYEERFQKQPDLHDN